MTTAEYDRDMAFVDFLRKLSKDADDKADELQDSIERKAKVCWYNRDPGFDCWKIEGINQYFPTVRHAIEAKEKDNEESNNPKS